VRLVAVLVGNFTNEGSTLAFGGREGDGTARIQLKPGSIIVVVLPGENPGRLGDDVGQISKSFDVTDVGQMSTLYLFTSMLGGLVRAIVGSINKSIVGLAIDGGDDGRIVSVSVIARVSARRARVGGA